MKLPLFHTIFSFSWVRKKLGATVHQKDPPSCSKGAMLCGKITIQWTAWFVQTTEVRCMRKWRRKVSIYPLVGSKVIARGSSRFSLMRTFLDMPFSLLTSILSVPVSVQYKFRATQSTATPSGCWTSLETITSASKQVHGEINCTL